MGAALLAAVMTGLATVLGALPFAFVRELPRRLYDGILGLGAGLMLAAATLGLLGEALRDLRADGELDVARLLWVLLGFGAGVGAGGRDGSPDPAPPRRRPPPAPRATSPATTFTTASRRAAATPSSAR